MEIDYEIAKSTPMMRQWYDVKITLKDEILFTRVGDFYELFYDDAIRASKILDLTLTKRKIGDGDYPMAGVPVRSIETYVSRLVKMGYKVAIIDQLEDPKATKTTLKRGLTRILTKGTITEETILSPGQNNYLAAIAILKVGKTRKIGLAVCDLSTGDFRAGEFTDEEKRDLLRAFTKYSPVEILYQQDIEKLDKIFGLEFDENQLLTPLPNFHFDPNTAKEYVYNQFNVSTVKGFGLDDSGVGIGVSGALIKYLKDTQFTDFPHIRVIRTFDVLDTMTLDATAIKSLELFENMQDHSENASLYSMMDETITPMGGRLLRHWISNPLANKGKIEERLNSVSLLIEDSILHHKLRSLLSSIGDVERLITRISMKNARPDELIKLASSLEVVPSILNLLKPYKEIFPKVMMENFDPCEDIVTTIRKTIKDDPSPKVGEGQVIKTGFNSELDRLRIIIDKGMKWFDEYVAKEQETTGINSIKVKQNNVFGYFLEIPRREEKKVPDYYVKKQVMVAQIRYFTEELKDYETEVLNAEINVNSIEEQIYQNVLNQLTEFVSPLQMTSQSIAILDGISSLAFLAERRKYVKPVIEDDFDYFIKNGRHPVIEALNESMIYVPNDVSLEYNQQRLLIITGPNFSGKSSLLRATALIAIMAQMGSFVPADEVKLGIIDRIFTRIGASDNLVAGQSTFMLEMIDAANLVNNCTQRSLIIADELGRGTSTYDGLAIAWSIAEFLHNSPNSPKTLIATHYHQLAELEDLLEYCKNYHFLIRFENEKPVFDHKLERGSSDRSFGIEVAKLAGIPDEVIERGRHILDILESQVAKVNPDIEQESSQKLVDLVKQSDNQLSLDSFLDGNSKIKSRNNSSQLTNSTKIVERIKIVYEKPEVIKELEALDIDSLTPVEALNKLVKLKEKLK